MFVLCKARWAAIVYEMRYINKAALPCLMFLQRYFLCVSDRPLVANSWYYNIIKLLLFVL